MIAQCLFSRLTGLSCLIIIVFVICITQEFTYILNLHSYISTTNYIENHPPMIQILAKNSLKHANFKREDSNSNVETREKNYDTFDTWQQVSEEVYAYSAYWDNRHLNSSFVRIIGGARITNNNTRLHLKCLFTSDLSSAIYTEVSSRYRILIEHHNKPGKALYIICSSDSYERPSHVALVPLHWNNTSSSNIVWMKIKALQITHTRSVIGLCVRPLFNYSDVFRIAEFVAYYEALGVKHFTFYDYDSSDDVSALIEQLKKNHYVIEILPWNLPANLTDMWALGQIASINDCIYRHMSVSSYVVVVDLDEFITPRHMMNLEDLLSQHSKRKKRYASFVFRSCVFCLEYDQDMLPSIIPNFITQTRIHRENRIYPYMVRTKYIVKPEHVIVAGVHHVWELILGYEERFIPASQALVHHYRANLCIGRNKTLEKGEIDVTSRKYLNPLLRSRTMEIWRNLFKGQSLRKTIKNAANYFH